MRFYSFIVPLIMYVPVPSVVNSDIVNALWIEADIIAHTRTVPSPSPTLSVAGTDTVTAA